MKNPLRAKLLLAVPGLLAAAGASAALVPTEWASRQAFTVPAPGIVQLTLPPAVHDTAQPDLADVRLVDADGREIPFLLSENGGRSAGVGTPPPFRPKLFTLVLTNEPELTTLRLETGTANKLDSIQLETPAPFFLKAAHVEISDDGVTWESVGQTAPVFRQFGAEQLSLSLGRQAAAFVRVTVDNHRSRPVQFSGARLTYAPFQPAPPVAAPAGARILRREEFANETVLTVGLDARNLSLATLGLEVTDPLFMRRVTVAVREADGTVARERTVATGTLYRVELEGAETRSQLKLPFPGGFTAPVRELLVHISNGDSPPLTLTGATAEQFTTDLIFNAPAAGTYRVLTGNPQAGFPHYDLAAFSRELRQVHATTVTAGPIEATPGYHPRESLAAAPLPDVPLAGAPLDTYDWAVHRPLHLDQAGVQELELDPAALAGAQAGYGDLRVLHGGNQIPYVLEHTALFRALAIAPVAEADPKRPNLSRWRVTLPQPGLPLSRLTLTSATPLFSRQFRVYEKITTPEGRAYEQVVAAGDWSRRPEPGVPETRAFALNGRLHTDTLWIETDNGDNPAIALGAVQAAYPVVRLIFKTGDTGGFELAYGHAGAAAPSYDLSLVAPRLLTAPRLAARFDAPGIAARRGGIGGLSGGVVFWTVLSLVVAGLLLAVAKLLPKSSAP